MVKMAEWLVVNLGILGPTGSITYIYLHEVLNIQIC